MKFKDLLTLPYDKSSGAIDYETLKTLLANTPDSVLKQLYVDHGRTEDFQENYGELNISLLHWECRKLKTSSLVHAECFVEFLPYLQAKEKSAESSGVSDPREEVVQSWKTHKTWYELPVFIDGGLIGKSSKLYLVEGHTRLGTLKGLYKRGEVACDQIHLFWYGALL